VVVVAAAVVMVVAVGVIVVVVAFVGRFHGGRGLGGGYGWIGGSCSTGKKGVSGDGGGVRGMATLHPFHRGFTATTTTTTIPTSLPSGEAFTNLLPFIPNFAMLCHEDLILLLRPGVTVDIGVMLRIPSEGDRVVVVVVVVGRRGVNKKL